MTNKTFTCVKCHTVFSVKVKIGAVYCTKCGHRTGHIKEIRKIVKSARPYCFCGERFGSPFKLQKHLDIRNCHVVVEVEGDANQQEEMEVENVGADEGAAGMAEDMDTNDAGDPPTNPEEMPVDDMEHGQGEAHLELADATVFAEQEPVPGPSRLGREIALSRESYFDRLLETHRAHGKTQTRAERAKELLSECHPCSIGPWVKGRAFVVTNTFMRGPKKKQLPGARSDADLMRELWAEVTGEGVLVATNVKKAEFLTYFNEFKERVARDQPDFIVVVISSHGWNDNVLLEDGNVIHVFNDLVYEISNDVFPGPKLYFIDTCQGIPQNQVINRPALPVEKDAHKAKNTSMYFVGKGARVGQSAYESDDGGIYLRALYDYFVKGQNLRHIHYVVDQALKRRTGGYQRADMLSASDFPPDFQAGV